MKIKILILTFFTLVLSSFAASEERYNSILDFDLLMKQFHGKWELQSSFLYDKLDKEKEEKFVKKELVWPFEIKDREEYSEHLRKYFSKFGIRSYLELALFNPDTIKSFAMSVYYFNSLEGTKEFMKETCEGKEKSEYLKTEEKSGIITFESKIVRRTWIFYKNMAVRSSSLLKTNPQKTVPFKVLKHLQKVKRN